MVFFNYALRKLNAKIVYYGPGLCGKTTNLVWIHDHFEGGERGKMISLATEGDRTIFFDLLPLEIGSIRGMNVTLQLYTVPGQVHYNSTRQLVLRGADGVVFVADSQRSMRDSNMESFRNLQENLLLQGISLEEFPLVLQFNKRDLKDLLPVEDLDSDLNIFRAPIFEAIATQGVGVQETLEGIVKLVMRNLRERYEGAGAGAREASAQDPAATMRAQPKPVPPQPQAPPTAKPDLRHPPAAPKAATRPPAQPPVTPPSDRPTPASPEPRPPQVKPAAPKPRTPEPASPPPRAPEPPTPQPPVAETSGSPADEIVFPEADGAITFEFNDTESTVFGDSKPKGGFEDEVSTAVYEDEVEVGPDDFSGGAGLDAAPPVGGASGGFADEPTSTHREPTSQPDFPGLGDGGSQDAQVFSEVPEPEAPPVVEEWAPDSGDDTEPAGQVEDEAPYDQLETVFVESAREAPIGEEQDEVEIEFVDTPDEGGAPPVVAPSETPPAEPPVRPVSTGSAAEAGRYVDSIQAPSPFAPRELSVPEAAPEPAPFDVSAYESFEAPHVEEEVVPAAEPVDEAAEVPETPAFGDVTPPESEPYSVSDDEDLFSDEVTPVGETPEREHPVEPMVPTTQRDVEVRAEDNQLQLRLQGTGAIVESGQVRALDIEVPVPGAWVGNRRVTLQLRLTLTPDTEADDDRPGGHS